MTLHFHTNAWPAVCAYYVYANQHCCDSKFTLIFSDVLGFKIATQSSAPWPKTSPSFCQSLRISHPSCGSESPQDVWPCFVLWTFLRDVYWITPSGTVFLSADYFRSQSFCTCSFLFLGHFPHDFLPSSSFGHLCEHSTYQGHHWGSESSVLSGLHYGSMSTPSGTQIIIWLLSYTSLWCSLLRPFIRMFARSPKAEYMCFAAVVLALAGQMGRFYRRKTDTYPHPQPLFTFN